MSFSTADLCDEYGEKVSVLNLPLQPYGAVGAFEGSVVTIQLDEDNGDLVKLLRDNDGEGRVVVVDVEGKYCAVVGDNLMGFAHKNGWAGIVINGYVRDTAVTRTIPVGLLALGTCPQKSPKKAASIQNSDLNMGGITIHSGDYLYADEDGVIVSASKL